MKILSSTPGTELQDSFRLLDSAAEHEANMEQTANQPEIAPYNEPPAPSSGHTGPTLDEVLGTALPDPNPNDPGATDGMNP